MSAYLDDDSSDDDSWVLEHHGLFSAKKKLPLSQRLVASTGSDSSDDDAPLIVKSSLKARRIISFDSSDDETNCSVEETTKEAAIDLTLQTPPKKETIDLTKQMEALNVSADTDGDDKRTQDTEASAWVHDCKNDEYFLSSIDCDIDGGVWPALRIPADLYNSLYPHQKVGVQWMASMHSKKIGGM